MTQIADVLPDVLPISREKAQTAIDLVQGLDSPALQWLAGFMAGAAARGGLGAPQTATPVAAAAGVAVQQQLTIVYGSQTGNAKRVAEKLAGEVQAAGLPVRLVRADAYRTSDLKKEKFLYLVVSTHSEGDAVEPPDDSRGFYEFLMGKRAPQLPELSFGVLALGDSSYVDFCGIGRRIDERLAALGATRLIERADADVDLDYVATPWAAQALQHARTLLAPASQTPEKAAGAAVVALHPAHTAWSRERPFLAEVLVNQRIVGSGSEKDVRHIELSLAGSSLHYQPGDALGVWPAQAPELVQRVLQALALDGDASVTQGTETLALTEWLTHRRELTVLTRPFVAALAERGGHESLKALLQPEGSAELAKLLNTWQLIDLLRAWPAPWDAGSLVAALRPLAPRMYSIASSQAQVDEEVHLTVALVQFEKEGEARWGVGSRYLGGAQEGAQVPVFIEANERFRLPADGTRDLIMVGPGTGVAPFRAFVQQRQADGASGRHWLFFGNPHRHSDFLYQNEWLQALKEGQLTHLDVAFSRDQAEKVYVQHRLLERGAEVWQWLQGGAHFYVCGDAERMAGDVQRALAQIAVTHGGKTPEDAADWVKTLLLEGRYARDVY